MKGIVIGLGSMGKRRIRLIQNFFTDVELCGVDTRADRRADVTAQFHIACYEQTETALCDFSPTVAFVCTSPLSHAGIITQLLQDGLHVFSEINLVDEGYEKNTDLARRRGRVLFLSSTPLYRREVQYICDCIADPMQPSFLYQYHVGQYLPDWHPWENIQDFFVGDRRTNGCRELLAIELPWLQRAFGPISHVSSSPASFSLANTQFPAAYAVTLRHENGSLGQLLVDVVSRKAIRRLTVAGNPLFLQWGGTPDSLAVFDPEAKELRFTNPYQEVMRDPRYADNIVENAYVDELAAFFDILAGKPARCHTFEEDAKVIGIIDRIEEVLR